MDDLTLPRFQGRLRPKRLTSSLIRWPVSSVEALLGAVQAAHLLFPRAPMGPIFILTANIVMSCIYDCEYN